MLLPLWNVWYFFSLYANAESYEATRPHGLARTCSTGTCWRRPANWSPTVTAQMDAYDISGACASVRSYLDALTNWYVRRSRDRFWAGDRDAFDTLYTVLETLSRVVAPLAPLTAEEIWRGLTGERSVHLTDWPTADDVPGRPRRWSSTMDAVRDVCSAALSLRKAQGPAGAAAAAHADRGDAAARRRCEPFADLVADEVNVKEVVFTDDVAGHCEQVLTVVPRALGPRARRHRCSR